MKRIPQHTLEFIDSWLSLTTKWEDVTGLSIAIMHKGKVVLEKTYGKASIEDNQALSKDHAFRVASHSKTFTAVAIMQLQEAGKLRIDDHVVDYLPWLKTHNDSRWAEVTIRQLLSHSAGVTRDGNSEGFWSLRTDFPDDKELKETVISNDLIITPNTKMKYSNYGYGLLGMIVSNISGLDYRQYVTQHIIDELRLTHTSPEYTKDLILATGYSRKNLSMQRFAFPRINTKSLAAATGFYSTPKDLCIFFDALKIGSGKLLTDESKREMQRKQWDVKKEDDSYGLGVDIGERHGYDLIGHSGGFPGFGSRTWMALNDDIVISVVVTNHDIWTGPIAGSVFAILSEFGDLPPRKEHAKYEQRFTGLQGAMEVISHAGGLRRIYPNGWWPMSTVDKLRVISDTTLEIYDTSGFDDEGEKIIYTFNKDGKIIHINEAGSLRYPSADDDLVPWWKVK